MSNNKKSEDRYSLRVKYWREGEEGAVFNGEMATPSLRSARNEFRARLTDALGIKIDREHMKEIVASGYVVVAGPVMPDANRMAMLLTDAEKPVENPTMYAFELRGERWELRKFDSEEALSQ